MAIEIERKFLVVSDGWKPRVTARVRLRDGLIAHFSGRKVRVRISEEGCWLTVKGKRAGIARPEFEYPIPRADADAMLKTMCAGAVIEKTRHTVLHEGIAWSVDVYHGALDGLVVAEVELESENQPAPHPPWVGQEITANPRFCSSRLFTLAEGGEELPGAGAAGPQLH